MANNKVTVIGFKGSGKTTYLTGMYIQMSFGVNNFSLSAKDATQDLYLEQLWSLISEGQKPDPSDQTEKYTFHISHNYKPIIDFDWLDYPGGILSQPNTPACQELIQDIKDSSCLLLILDGELFSRIKADSVDEYKRQAFNVFSSDIGIRNEVKMFGLLSSQGYKLPPIGIVVTKCDLIPDEYQEAVKGSIRGIFNQLFDEPDRIVLIMSVSLGGNIEPGFQPNVFNIAQPIAFAVISILMNYMIAANIQKNENQVYITSHSGLISSLINSGSIEKASQNLHLLNQALDRYSQDAFKLIEVFSDKKTIYAGGIERNLHDFYKEAFRAISNKEMKQ